MIREAARGNRDAVAGELRVGADPDRLAGDGSALACAAAVHEEGVVALLLDEGATPSPMALRAAVAATTGPLELPELSAPAGTGPEAAARQGVVRLLLDHGADPDLTSDKALSPLLAAGIRGDRAMVELLLTSGANRTPTVRAGVKTPAEAARAAGHPDLVDLLTPP